jgi:non-heme chloroperoxidase
MGDDEIARKIEEALDPSIDPAETTIAAACFARLATVDLSDLPQARFERMRDGLPLAVREYAGNPERLLVIVHGAGGHGGHLHGLARTLANAGAATVVVPDLRGNGLSAVRRSDAVTHPEQLRDDLLDLLAALRARHPAARIVLSGHSAGGGLVLRLFADGRRPDVAGVALLAPLLGGGPPTTRPGLGGWVSLYGRRLKALLALNRLGVDGLNSLTVMEFNLPPESRDGCETLAWSFATMRAFGPGNWQREAAAVGVPLAVLIGDADECFVASALPDALGAVAPGAVADVLADCGHWDLLADPRTAAWLDNVLAGH